MTEPGSESGGDHSILKDLVLNQYQAILLAGVVALSVLGASGLPLLIWGGGQLVALPLLDSRPLRQYFARRKRARARASAEAGRVHALEALQDQYGERYEAMHNLCQQIEANYQQLNGLSQAYLSEQRGKLDVILDGCLHRLLALQRYAAMLERRTEAAVQLQIKSLEREMAQPELPERARAALQRNIQLKHQLADSLKEARGTMKALATELDSMTSLLEVLHQNSIAMRDPVAVSQELDAIARQSEDSERVVREMEALVHAGELQWEDAEPVAGSTRRRVSSGSGADRRRRERN